MATLPFLYIANWKMNKTLDEGMHYFYTNKEKLDSMAKDAAVEIIFAPSFPSLVPLQLLAHESSVYLAAQDCSEYESGPYNGQVDATSLAQIGLRYCVIGHSDQRNYARETDLTVTNKAQRLFDVGIRPIICVGETAQEHKEGKGKEVVARQLKMVFELLSTLSPTLPICIAYEPVWAIGGGFAVELGYVADIVAWIQELTALLPQHVFYCVYGGGVDEKNAASLRSIDGLNGLLIGGASLDFQKFEKIVSLTKSKL